MDDMHHIQLELNHVSNELQGLSCKNIGMMIPSIRGQYMAMFPGAARLVNRLQTNVVGLQSLKAINYHLDNHTSISLGTF